MVNSKRRIENPDRASTVHRSLFTIHPSRLSEGENHPHGRADQAALVRVVPNELPVAGLIDEEIRYAVRRRDLDHVELPAYAVLFHRVGAALQYRYLRLERGIELVTWRRRRRFRERLQVGRPAGRLRCRRQRQSEHDAGYE